MRGLRVTETEAKFRTSDGKATLIPRLPLLLLTIYDSLLLVQQIGFDRSAFVAGRHKVSGQSKNKESSKCPIHDEGLLEHPIKS